MTVQPDATRKGLIGALIDGLKNDGVWAKLDWLSVLAAHDAQAARINWRNPSQVSTEVNAPTFTTDRGYIGAFGPIANLDTGVLDSAAGNSTQDSSTLFAWVNLIGASGGSAIGTVTGTAHRIRVIAATSRNYAVHGSSGALAVAAAPSTGLFSGSRINSTTVNGYYNGALDGTAAATTSTAPAAVNISILSAASGGSDNRVAAAGWGAGLNATENLALYTRLNTFLTAIGGA